MAVEQGKKGAECPFSYLWVAFPIEGQGDGQVEAALLYQPLRFSGIQENVFREYAAMIF
jgi:hypothetical protein